MATIRVNMKQFRERWKTYADNVTVAERISETSGNFLTLCAAPYVLWLNEFNIFYTVTKETK
jgi:hypothetical protein